MNALITGASSGIGRAIALAIASSGGALCLIGRNLERLDAVTQEAKSSADKVLTFVADLGIDRDIEDLATYVRNEFKSLDTLIHCAGLHVTGSIEQISLAHFDELYRTNVRAPYALTQALLPLLRSHRGQIVFINSSQGLKAGANNGAYASTKHALKAIADSLRDEVNADCMRVLSVYPGRTATLTMKALYGNESRPYEADLLQPADIAQIVVSTLQLPQTAEVTNIEIRPSIKSY